ncbi:glycosyltransferase family 4 protein [Sinorhizobium sp. BG8]|uniref:glycosyltransferase family 4 protein n=1 Tax=Sinorhizobium sp. BG8 TaxID=2613773 RepID=UPI001FEFEE17|nr:glycosyltransferase family 4 protein [Sinorhizobium sp. BG8]
MDAPLAVQVVRQYAPSRGGLEDVVKNLSHQLLIRGYRVRVVTLERVFTELESKLPHAETIDGIEVVRVPFSGSTRYPIAPGVFRHVRDADIVHVHAIDFFFDALAWGRFLHGKPMVATTHGGFFHTSRYAAFKAVWFNTLTRISSRAYDRLIGCSPQDARLFRPIAGERVIEIGNGADTSKFHDAASHAPVKRMATIGRFSINKRLDNLLDTMKALVASDPDWHLDIIGVPGNHSAADIATMIAARRLEGNVEVHLGLPNQEIREVLGRSSFFASASEYEGFGLVAVEAMSAGLVPLLQPNTAYRDLAARHSDIRLCDFGDADSAANMIPKEFDLLQRSGPSMRESAMQAASFYSWDKVAERYAEIYRDVLERNSSRRNTATHLEKHRA